VTAYPEMDVDPSKPPGHHKRQAPADSDVNAYFHTSIRTRSPKPAGTRSSSRRCRAVSPRAIRSRQRWTTTATWSSSSLPRCATRVCQSLRKSSPRLERVEVAV